MQLMTARGSHLDIRLPSISSAAFGSMAAGDYKDPPRAVKQNAFADTSELLKIQTNAKSTLALFATLSFFFVFSVQSVHWK
jgi:hypothetical protein